MNNIIELWNVFALCFFIVTFVFILTDLEDIVFSDKFLTFMTMFTILGIIFGFTYH